MERGDVADGLARWPDDHSGVAAGFGVAENSGPCAVLVLAAGFYQSAGLFALGDTGEIGFVTGAKNNGPGVAGDRTDSDGISGGDPDRDYVGGGG